MEGSHMKLFPILVLTWALAGGVYAEEPFTVPGQQPFDPSSMGNPNIGGNPYTFNDANQPYGRGGNPSSKGGTSSALIPDSPLTPFEQTGSYRGKLTPPRTDVDSIGNTYGRYGDRHSLDSMNSMRGSDNPLSPFGRGWRIEGSR